MGWTCPTVPAMTRPDYLVEVVAACAALTTAVERAMAAIEGAEPEQAYLHATRLATVLTGSHQALANSIATLRARSAGRIQDTEQLSLAALAIRLGVSKARADQLVKRAKQAREDKTP